MRRFLSQFAWYHKLRRFLSDQRTQLRAELAYCNEVWSKDWDSPMIPSKGPDYSHVYQKRVEEAVARRDKQGKSH